MQNNDTKDLGRWISRISTEEIQSKGLLISKNIKDENNNQTYLVIESLKLKEISDQLVRPSPKDRYLNMMDSICNSNEISAVLLQYLRVKVGDDAEWVGLGPKVGQSSSFLESVVRECGTGKILWENECFIRDLPNSENKIFEDTIKAQFLTLTILGGSK
jgi:hypothetical protein